MNSKLSRVVWELVLLIYGSSDSYNFYDFTNHAIIINGKKFTSLNLPEVPENIKMVQKIVNNLMHLKIRILCCKKSDIEVLCLPYVRQTRGLSLKKKPLIQNENHHKETKDFIHWTNAVTMFSAA